MEKADRLGLADPCEWTTWEPGRHFLSDMQEAARCVDALDAGTIAHLLFTLQRQDRFCAGEMAAAYHSVLMAAMLKSLHRRWMEGGGTSSQP